MNQRRIALAFKAMAGREPNDDRRLDSGDLGSTPLIRPEELAAELVDALSAAAPSLNEGGPRPPEVSDE